MEEQYGDSELYCIVNVGRAAGKVKFCLLDEHNQWIPNFFIIKCILVDSKDGSGPNVVAVAIAKHNQILCRPVSELVWEAHHGNLTDSGINLRHINGNTMDNRLVNLTSKPVTIPIRPAKDVYWECMSQLVEGVSWTNLPDSHIDGCVISRVPVMFECHYLPCTELEQKPLQYSICSACQEVRYCSSTCQHRDWPYHKEHCTPKRHPPECANPVYALLEEAEPDR